MPRHLCVWLTHWPIQRIRCVQKLAAAREPSSIDQNVSSDASPVLVWDTRNRQGTRAGQTRVVVACCDIAASLRVRPGMPISQAVSLCEHEDREPIVQLHDRRADKVAIERVAAILQQTITPMVAVEVIDARPWAGYPRHQPESLLADIDGVPHLFGGETGLLDATADRLSSIGLSGCMAIADTAAMAWAIAHQEQTSAIAHHKQTSAIAHHKQTSAVAHQQNQTSNGHTASNSQRHHFERVIVPAGSVTLTQPGVALTLPITSLRIDVNTRDQLNRLGIQRIEQLLQLPRSGLVSRLGATLVQRLDAVLGGHEPPIDVYKVESKYKTTHPLEYPTADAAILLDRLGTMVERLVTEMSGDGHGILRLRCIMELVDEPEIEFELGLFAPTSDGNHLSGLLATKIETLSLAGQAHRLHLRVTLTGPMRSAQSNLFETFENEGVASQMAGSAISRLVDVLSGRLGRQRVVDVQSSPDPLPEKAFEYRPLAGRPRVIARRTRAKRRTRNSHAGHRAHATPADSLPSSKTGDAFDGDFLDSATFESTHHGHPRSPTRRWGLPSRHDAMRRPLSLFASPISLQFALGTSHFVRVASDPRFPKRFQVGGVCHRVVRSWGPERIETGWWNGPMVRRDYWRIETDQNQWWWIYQQKVPPNQASDTSDAQTDSEPTGPAQPNPGPSDAVTKKSPPAQYQWWWHGRFS